jgi:hypothetical protein
MANYTPQQVLENDMIVLGEDFGRLYNAIKNEYLRLKIKWDEYNRLYCVNQEQIDFLNKYAPFFFSQIQQLMINDIVLHINRINYSKGKTYKYLTIQKLPDLISDEYHKKNIMELVQKSVDCSKYSDDRRNRYIAHRSLELFTDPNTRQIDAIKNSNIDKSIDCLWDIIIYIEHNYFKNGMINEIIAPFGGAETLLYKMKNA